MSAVSTWKRRDGCSSTYIAHAQIQQLLAVFLLLRRLRRLLRIFAPREYSKRVLHQPDQGVQAPALGLAVLLLRILPLVASSCYMQSCTAGQHCIRYKGHLEIESSMRECCGSQGAAGGHEVFYGARRLASRAVHTTG